MDKSGTDLPWKVLEDRVNVSLTFVLSKQNSNFVISNVT